MKVFIYTLILIAAALIVYNFTFLDFDKISNGDSGTALIGILASSIVIVLLVILLMSRAIASKVEE